LGVLSPWINDARTFAPGTAAVVTPGFDGVLVGAHRETHFVREHSIVANKAQAAAPATRPTRVGNHFEAFHSGRKFRFDDFDGRGLELAKMKGCGRASFLAGTRPSAAAKDFIVHVGPIVMGVVSAKNQGGAAGTAGDSFLRCEGCQGS